MSSWLNTYMQAIEERDAKEKANESLFNAYSLLADRTAGLAYLKTEQANLIRNQPSGESNRDSKSKAVRKDAAGLDVLAKVREDLGEAQRSKGAMQAQLQSLTEETQRLREQSKVDRKRIGELALEKSSLATRMRDLNEELKGKAKLLEHVHDETISLELQLNMAEEQSRKLRQENKELVDRWMIRMGEEAEAMNKASRFS